VAFNEGHAEIYGETVPSRYICAVRGGL